MKTQADSKLGFVRIGLGMVVAAGLLAVSVIVAQAQTTVQPGTTTTGTGLGTATGTGTGAQMAAGKGERHPEIHKSIAMLERAKEVLKDKAAHDFAGHREKAVEHIEQALKQLRECLEEDKK